MIVMDVRMPVQPAVPVVQSLAAGASATTTSRPEDPHVTGRDRRAAARSHQGFTAGDRALCYAVTGEDVWAIDDDLALSPFAAQLLADRRGGTLPSTKEVSSAYLLRVGAHLDSIGAPNPYSGAHLRRALLFLESRTTGRVDVVL